MLYYRLLNRVSGFLLLATVALAGAVAGCGFGTDMTGPVLRGNTTVVVLLSSTANDQLSQFNVTFNSLTLTSQSGKVVNFFITPQTAEFMHLNGSAEPLITVSIPEDVYTAASLTMYSPAVSCLTLLQGGVLSDEVDPGGTAAATVSVPSPITVTGTAMGLLLNLQISQSVTPANCPLTANYPSITPTFTLTPVTLASQPTNVQNGKMTSLVGLVSSINATTNGFTVTAADGPTWSVQSSKSTAYQGVAGFSTLVAGLPVDLDVSIQQDGSLLASRVAVQDANPTNLSRVSGPLLFVASSEPALLTFRRDEQGFLFPPGLLVGSPLNFSFGNAVYQISGQFTNLQSLPFAPMLNAGTIFAGQNVSFTAHAVTFASGPTYVPATTITLMPQTINGTVTAVGSEGSFTTYTVSLAAYDLIPDLAVQPGQTTATTNPSSVVVYVDSNTQQLNSKQLTVGNVFRFNGLLFNDSGTLRLDCAQVNDGVPE